MSVRMAVAQLLRGERLDSALSCLNQAIRNSSTAFLTVASSADSACAERITAGALSASAPAATRLRRDKFINVSRGLRRDGYRFRAHHKAWLPGWGRLSTSRSERRFER